MELFLLLLFVPFVLGSLFGEDDPEEIDGTPGDDTLSGTDGQDLIHGHEGDDLIDSGAGHDDIYGGAGSDAILGGAGGDDIRGDAGGDLIVGEEGGDSILGGDGDDYVDGGSGNDTIWMGAGNDVIADDSLYLGDEVNTGAAGDDYINGGDGDDWLGDWIGANTLEGGLGRDFVHTVDLQGTDAPDLATGGWGMDTLVGDDGDTLSGGGSHDEFWVVADEAEDRSVTITDFDANNETLSLEIDQATFGDMSQADLSVEVDPQTGDVVVSLGEVQLVRLIDPAGEFTLGNVTLPDWMPAAA